MRVRGKKALVLNAGKSQAMRRPSLARERNEGSARTEQHDGVTGRGLSRPPGPRSVPRFPCPDFRIELASRTGPVLEAQCYAGERHPGLALL